MDNKLCIVITGLDSCGKTYFSRKLKEDLSGKNIVEEFDLFCWNITEKQAVKDKVKEFFYKTGIDVLILETHPPFIYDLTSEGYEIVYIHLCLPFDLWKKNILGSNKNFGFMIGNVYYGGFIENCLSDSNYYYGAANAYEQTCTRKTETKTFCCSDDAVNYIKDFIAKTIPPVLPNRIKEFKEFSQKKLLYLSPNYEIFQYQSFDYGNGVENIGMSDPCHKWNTILQMDKFDLWKKDLLDIGSNIGEISHLAALAGATVDGIEFDENFHEAAVFLQTRFRTRPVNLINASFMEYQFTKKYHVVMALSVLYLFYKHYSIEDVIAKVRSLTKEIFIGELTVNNETKDRIYAALKSNFDRVELVGDSFRTNVSTKIPWKDRTDKSSTRQVWHCYV